MVSRILKIDGDKRINLAAEISKDKQKDPSKYALLNSKNFNDE